MVGRGSYGEVWIARNVMGTYRAVKVVYRDTFDRDEPYEREFAGIRKFEPVSRSHESQVDVLHIGRNDQKGYFYYVMELADDAGPRREGGGLKTGDGSEANGRRDGRIEHGGFETQVSGQAPSETAILTPPSCILSPETYMPRTLQHELDTRGRLPFEECLEIGLALAGALKHLHGKGLVHRDIKPSNIIYVNGIPKLADIGLVTDSEATLTYVGAQGFMAPEGPGRPRGDIFSLGKVIYEMCTGRDRLDFPAVPENFGEWRDRADVLELLDVSHTACEPEPARRYVSAEALATDLLHLQAGKSLKRMRWLERNRRLVLAVAGVAVLAALAGWLVTLGARVRERSAKDSQEKIARASQRESLLRDAQLLRVDERREGWASNALHLLQGAGQIGLGQDLRDQAAASLEGLDAHLARRFPKTPVAHLAFDLQGKYLLMDAGGRGQVQLWDTQRDQITSFGTTNTGPVWFASGGSPRQFSADERGGLWLLNPESGDRLREFSWPEGTVEKEWVLKARTDSHGWSFCAAASADGLLCAAALACRTNSKRDILAVWESETGKLVTQSAEGCSALAFTPDNACLATGDDEGRVRVRALSGLTEVASFPQDRSRIHCLALARDPSQASDGSVKYPWLVATGDAGGTINIYQVAIGRLRSICRGSHYDVYTVAFSPDGMTLASGGREAIRCWDVATGRSLLTVNVGDNHHALAFSRDGSKLGVGALDGPGGPATSGVVELEPSRGVMALRGFTSQSAKVEFSHDGQRLAALSHNWELGIWNLYSNRLEWLLQAPKGLSADNAALAFSRDDSQLAFATLTDARLWDLKTGTLSNSWRLPQGLVQQLCFDRAGRLLHFQMDWPEEKQARVCRVRDLFRTNYVGPLAELSDFSNGVFDAVLSREGDFLVVAGVGVTGSNIVRAFDPTSGRQLLSLPDTGNKKNDWLAADPQTSRIGYSVGGSGETRFYGIPGGELWRAVPMRTAEALAPDGRFVAAHPPKGKGVLVLGVDSPAWRLTLGIDHTAAMWPRFSPSGRLLAWGTSDGTVLVCDMAEAIRRLEQLGLGWR